MGGGHTQRIVLGEQNPRYNAIRLQTSTQGMAIPVVFGTTRVTGNFLWMGDFQAIYQAQITRESGGGKGGGSGAVYTKQISYTYQIAFAIGLCEGPVQRLIRMWASKSKFEAIPSNLTLVKGAHSQSPWSYLTANHHDKALNYPSLAYVASSNYNTGESASLSDFTFEVTGLLPADLPVTITYNAISNWDFSEGNPPTDWPVINFPGTYIRDMVLNPDGVLASCAHVIDGQGWGGFLQKLYGTVNGTTYTVSFWYKVLVGTLDVLIKNDAEAFEFQAILPHVDDDWHYYETTYREVLAGTEGFSIKFFNMVLGVPAEFLVYKVRIEGTYSAYDSNPSDIVSAIITNTTYGLGLPDDLIDVVDYGRWCLAMGFLLSPAFVSQQPAAEHIETLLKETFATAIWHNCSTMKVIPYGDIPVTGNGISWIPDTTPQYDLDDDDFLVDGAEEPVRVRRKNPANCYNDVKIECLDRNNDYNVALIEEWDQSSIDTYLTRPMDTSKMHDICDPSQGTTLAKLIVQREVNIRNEYTFRLGWKYCLLEPMTVVTLTDAALGMNKLPVRIIEIEEDEEWRLTIIAEEFPEGVANAPATVREAAQSYIPNFSLNPGNTESPLIFLAPSALWADASKPEVWIAASGGSIWGGCDLHVSTDGATYQYMGTILGRPRIGSLTAGLPVGSDPDGVNTCSVDITPSLGQLLSGTQLDADNLVTLCAVIDGGVEIISYQTATLTGSYKYGLAYLRRGAKGTQISYHPPGSRFLRLDELIVKVQFEDVWLHQLVYFKMCSFNIWKSGLQDLADVVAYPFVIQGQISDLMVGTDSVIVGPWISDAGTGEDSISVSK